MNCRHLDRLPDASFTLGHTLRLSADRMYNVHQVTLVVKLDRVAVVTMRIADRDLYPAPLERRKIEQGVRAST